MRSQAASPLLAREIEPTEIPRLAHPARHGLYVLGSLDRYLWAPPGPRPALAEVAQRLGYKPEAWVVFNHLLADFQGTLFELADVCRAAAA
ncbi:hypothetical protein [Embleya sp. NPDC001921]